MKRLFIFGTSGQARDVADVGAAIGYNCCFVAANVAEVGKAADFGEVVTEADIAQLSGEHFAIGIGENRVRQKIADRYRNRLCFPNLLHPLASFGRGQLDLIARSQGIVVCAGVRFTNTIQIGNFCFFNLNATIAHDCEIGDFVNVSPGANISGNVRIGSGAWIGTGAAINQGVPGKKLEIGMAAMIGSGAVVTGDCDPDGVYVGIPARRI